MREWEGDLEMPLVSIVCHTYNHKEFVENALNGFLMQETTFPFEIIIHDDASIDGTQEIIKQYQERYPSIIKPIFQEANIFRIGHRPTMYSFPAANGKYIAFCEGDDYWIDRYKVQKQTAFLEDNLDTVICYTDSTPFADGAVVDMDFGGARRDLSATELQKGPAIYTLTVCFRNVLDNPPELALVRYGDKFMWSRLGKYGKGKFLAEIQPSLYRVHSGGVHSSSSAVEKNMMYFQTYTAMAAYYKRLGEDELYQYFVGKLKNKVYSSDGISQKLIKFLVPISELLRKLKRFLLNQ
ncbi:glycosyl transferase family protein [Marinobacter lipolyticus SM19]|uniref:Glycosyl transferase family protein n=1 Tax=Marinobacter lipolyticus SM19 TaxID=1318628 RepID=R8B5P7_9GAMM|nr:glycosyltransferase [Marinobacter lipolyticus]EON93917.1 glycosyl transferase family protein [Marinobacter lipolyticus SM19]